MLKRWKHKLTTISTLNCSKNINFFQQVKNHFSWNIFKQHAQWFSCKVALSYFNKIRTSKICSMVKRLSHPMHTGSSSPFNKKEWVRKEWPMCNWAITVSSFLFVRGENIKKINTGNILYNLFSGNSSHSDCHSSNIYLFVCGFRSENGMSSTEMSPSRASVAAEFPLMPTWPGTQMKTISLPSLVISVYKIWTKTGWSYFRFKINCNDERESDNIKNDFSLE